MAAGSGIERLRRLVGGYLTYVEADTFPGGCFFASVLAEVDMHAGAVRDRLVGFLADWLDRIETAARDAQAEGSIDPAEDPAQIAFEVEAALLLANAQYVVTRSPEPIERARRAVDHRLAAAANTERATTARSVIKDPDFQNGRRLQVVLTGRRARAEVVIVLLYRRDVGGRVLLDLLVPGGTGIAGADQGDHPARMKRGQKPGDNPHGIPAYAPGVTGCRSPGCRTGRRSRRLSRWPERGSATARLVSRG
jgi:hypothetical protein